MSDLLTLLRDEITNAREASKQLYDLVHEKHKSDGDLMLLTSVLEDATQNAFDIVFDDIKR